MTTAPTTPYPNPETVRKALTPFKVMAFVVGVGLLLLVLEIVLNHVLDIHWLDWWAMPHGFLYMIYLVTTFNLGSAAKWPLPRLLGVMLAGVVPFLSFVVEHRVAREVEGRLAA